MSAPPQAQIPPEKTASAPSGPIAAPKPPIPHVASASSAAPPPTAKAAVALRSAPVAAKIAIKPPAAKPVPAKPAQPHTPAAEPQDASGFALPLPSTPSTAKASPPPAPVNADDLRKAEKSNPIEMAPPGKMGVGKIDGDAVVMQSGTRVRAGERFNSGERLLSVDAAAGKIVTDRRTVVLMN